MLQLDKHLSKQSGSSDVEGETFVVEIEVIHSIWIPIQEISFRLRSFTQSGCRLKLG